MRGTEPYLQGSDTTVSACRAGYNRLRITQPDELDDGLVGSDLRHYFSFAYSALASFRMGMSGSASFQRAKKSWYAARAFAVSPERTEARARPRWASAPSGKFTTMPRWSRN